MSGWWGLSTRRVSLPINELDKIRSDNIDRTLPLHSHKLSFVPPSKDTVPFFFFFFLSVGDWENSEGGYHLTDANEGLNMHHLYNGNSSEAIGDESRITGFASLFCDLSKVPQISLFLTPEEKAQVFFFFFAYQQTGFCGIVKLSVKKKKVAADAFCFLYTG